MAIPPHITSSSAAIATRASLLPNLKSLSSARFWTRFEQLPPVRGFRCETAKHHPMPPTRLRLPPPFALRRDPLLASKSSMHRTLGKRVGPCKSSTIFSQKVKRLPTLLYLHICHPIYSAWTSVLHSIDNVYSIVYNLDFLSFYLRDVTELGCG